MIGHILNAKGQYHDYGKVGATLITGNAYQSNFADLLMTFLVWNCLHLARLLKDNQGIPAHGNQPEAWEAGCRSDFSSPEHRV